MTGNAEEDTMALITEAQRTKLTANWTASKAAGRHLDHCPVVRLKSELGQHVLLTEMNPENLDHVFGLVNDYCYCDEGIYQASPVPCPGRGISPAKPGHGVRRGQTIVGLSGGRRGFLGRTARPQ